MDGQIWVDVVGELIVARVRGTPTVELIQEVHEQVVLLAREAGRGKVLYDGLEMEVPPVQVPMAQWKLDQTLGDLHLRRAILVPNSRLAYVARLAFGEGDYKVFYNDFGAAVRWLTDDPRP